MYDKTSLQVRKYSGTNTIKIKILTRVPAASLIRITFWTHYVIEDTLQRDTILSRHFAQDVGRSHVACGNNTTDTRNRHVLTLVDINSIVKYASIIYNFTRGAAPSDLKTGHIMMPSLMYESHQFALNIWLTSSRWVETTGFGLQMKVLDARIDPRFDNTSLKAPKLFTLVRGTTVKLSAVRTYCDTAELWRS